MIVLIKAFSDEIISTYINYFDLTNKRVLCFDETLDQAFNCIVQGASEVDVLANSFDTYRYYIDKRKIILNSLRSELFTNIKKLEYVNKLIDPKKTIRNNNYLLTEDNYVKLKEYLANKSTNIITKANNSIDKVINKEYDYIFLSNIFYNSLCSNVNNWVDDNLSQLFSCLDKEGLIQFLYIYNFDYSMLMDNKSNINVNLHRIFNVYQEDLFTFFNGDYSGYKQDAIITLNKVK